ncbi:TetR/AcrR family transcriptional regulator [Actinocorallia sp. API 0066]|uniref:TetR/AcrR family transcriptional regulator n=1 Tax=Actinocorallia sp. API 0066 TaxID=2896846 RepID=UPI001E409D13|nr:TetR/AcrR family transcriptional regulator [Actinocorallia sp. API 0066]MCD0449421.1 TetR/AcrR family transcriptional regulator [Actinocorallia sp. API 0066]
MRLVLTRELVVHTAVEIVERRGADGLSMRAVGEELGVTAMAVYRHVDSRESLIAGVAEYVMATMDVPESADGTDWKDEARILMRAFRGIAREYPRSLALVLETGTAIPVGLRAFERALSLCAEAGLDGPVSVRVVRALMAWTLGSQMRARPERAEGDPADVARGLGAACFPYVVALPDESAAHGSDADFEFGLELFLTAVEMMCEDRADG